MMRFSCRVAGISLVEVLVVIAIIGIVIALTMAAVQRVRSAAAQAVCSNQLRQLSLALHNHAAQTGYFPPGVRGDESGDPYPFLSFHARLLPYLEQQARWQQIETAFRKSKNFLDDPPHTGLSTAMPQFGCPLDSRTLSPQLVYGRDLRALTSYLGVEGTNSAKQDGILFLDSRVRPDDVKDGLSNTIALGERPASSNCLFGWWYGGWGQDKDGEADMVLGARTKNSQGWIPDCPAGPYSYQTGSLNNLCDTFHFWSLHPGGTNFAFADGSVRFLRYSADSILPALATRAGGEVVPSLD